MKSTDIANVYLAEERADALYLGEVMVWERTNTQ